MKTLTEPNRPGWWRRLVQDELLDYVIFVRVHKGASGQWYYTTNGREGIPIKPSDKVLWQGPVSEWEGTREVPYKMQPQEQPV